MTVETAVTDRLPLAVPSLARAKLADSVHDVRLLLSN
jgi:hypothetical protein